MAHVCENKLEINVFDPGIPRDVVRRELNARKRAEAKEHLKQAAGKWPDLPTEKEIDDACDLLYYVHGERDGNSKVIFPPEIGVFNLASRSMGDDYDDELPCHVRGLINYPLVLPVLFDIDLSGSTTSCLDNILHAFADQYALIYEDPDKYGVWGHCLEQLDISELTYFPDRKLIYPNVCS
jgi:hypothetical protein